MRRIWKAYLVLLAALLGACIAVPAFAATEDVPYVEDEILVVYNGEAPESGEEPPQVVTVPLEGGQTVEDAIAQAESDPDVAFAQPNYTYELIDPVETDSSSQDESAARLYSLTAQTLGVETLSLVVPNDPYLSNGISKNSWHLRNINAYAAWEKVKCEGAVTVALIDTGVLSTHEDLASNLLLDYAYNAVTKELPGADLGDTTGHGSHVAGIVAAAANNGLGTAGVSYNANVLPVRIFREGNKTSSSYAVAGINYVIDLAQEHPELNIRVINCSIGSTVNDENSDRLLHDTIIRARQAGIVTVCAAGNNGRADTYMWPSDYQEVAAVTALSTDGVSPASFSAYNKDKDICAPGQDILSTHYSGTSSYTSLSGTSMAAPMVSAALATLWAYRPSLTVGEALNALYQSAAPLEVPEDREGKYGVGRLDLLAALEYLDRESDYVAIDYCPNTYLVLNRAEGARETGCATYKSQDMHWIPDMDAWGLLLNERPDSVVVSDFGINESAEINVISKPNFETASDLAGDVSGNDVLNVVDAQLVYEMGCGQVALAEDNMRIMLLADVNGTGEVNALDAFAIQRAALLGW